MKFTIKDLQQYIIEKLDLYLVVDILNKIGLEVENLVPNLNDYDKIIVAEILETNQHPNADRLKVCKVSDGKNLYQIVCGAPNARTGIKVALSQIGAIIPNGKFEIKKSKIRDIESEGMMCSGNELGLSDETNGIMELDSNSKLGNAFAIEYDILGKHIIEIKLTPNRGDAASIYGIARDISATLNLTLKKQEIINIKEDFSSKITLDHIENGIFFSGREIRGIKNCESPQWLLDKLKIFGLKSKNFVVDILNYLMFEFGQPMHTYDLSKIGEKISVTFGKNENFLDLQGENQILNEKILVIRDEKNPLCIAGIIGGENSKTTIETTNLFLEAAYFPSEIIAISGQNLNIISDSRFRFERGIDYVNTINILNLACKLIIEQCGGQIGSLIQKGILPQSKKLNYDSNLTEKILGYKIEKERQISILEKLGFKVINNENFLQLEIPNWRHDISIQEDIIEEIGRINGYDKIISTSIFERESKKKINFYKINSIKKTLAGSLQMNELINFSFVNPEYAKIFGEINENLTVLNPLSKEISQMRNSLLIGLLDFIKNNQKIDINSFALFEEGMVFKDCTEEKQTRMISGIRSGNMILKDHFHENRDCDIFDVKKDIFIILEQNFGIKNAIIKEKSIDYCHPKKCFSIIFNNIKIGYFGQIHPRVQKIFEIKNSVYFFELFLENIPEKFWQNRVSAKFIENDIQSIIREFSFIVDENIKVDQIINSYKNEIISKIEILDIYQGDKILPGKKSISIRYILQPNETLNSNQLEKISNDIIDSVCKKSGAILRDGLHAT